MTNVEKLRRVAEKMPSMAREMTRHADAVVDISKVANEEMAGVSFEQCKAHGLIDSEGNIAEETYEPGDGPH